MSSTVSAMRSKLMSALNKIGKNNGHSCPQTSSNTDPIMHEFLVSTDAHAFFGKRRDEAKKQLLAMDIATDIEEAVDNVCDTGLRETVTLMKGERYMLTLDVKTPARRLDTKKLRNDLILDYDWTVEDVDELLERAMVYNAPAKTFKVIAAE